MKNEVVKISQELIKAKVNKHSSIIEKQILYLAIWYWSKNKSSMQVFFSRTEFEKMFNKEFREVNEIKKNLKSLSLLQYELIDDVKEEYLFMNVFSSMQYSNGNFQIKFNNDIVPVLEQVERHFLLISFKILANFKSGFSVVLYEKIKTEWARKSIYLTREQLYSLFSVEDKKSYNNWNNFKSKILSIATDEINKHTEYNIDYIEQKEGRKIIGVTLYFDKKKEKSEYVTCHFNDRIRKTESCFNKCNKIKNCTMLINYDLFLDIQYHLLCKLRNKPYEVKFIKMYEQLGELEKLELEEFVSNQLSRLGKGNN